MTVAYRCDGPGCELILDDDAARLALEIVNAPETLPDLDDDSQPFALISTLSLGFTGTHHFCSAECLAAWAMERHLTGDQHDR